ncbi:MAG: hypothetical protein JO362_21965 [Streptomycetaceae bacterium]|nr:hypothetical protein [Streptomycetaceae bacterium]
MSEEMGGLPFPDGEDHGGPDEEFASVVFDEAFIRAAAIHEPTAKERMLAAAQARAESDRARARIGAADDEGDDGRTYDSYRAGRHSYPEDDDDEGHAWPLAPHRRRRPYGGHSRWHRAIAWLLALIMGIGVVALTFAAVYRGAAGGSRQPSSPPANGRIDTPTAHPSLHAASPAAIP